MLNRTLVMWHDCTITHPCDLLITVHLKKGKAVKTVAVAKKGVNQHLVKHWVDVVKDSISTDFNDRTIHYGFSNVNGILMGGKYAH